MYTNIYGYVSCMYVNKIWKNRYKTQLSILQQYRIEVKERETLILLNKLLNLGNNIFI